MNSKKYTLRFTQIKPFNKDKVTQFMLGISFIRSKSRGLIVQGGTITIFKKANQINTTSFVREIISYIEEEIKLVYAKEEEYGGQIELNQLEPLKRKLELILEKLKQHGTIGENPVKNIH